MHSRNRALKRALGGRHRRSHRPTNIVLANSRHPSAKRLTYCSAGREFWTFDRIFAPTVVLGYCSDPLERWVLAYYGAGAGVYLRLLGRTLSEISDVREFGPNKCDVSKTRPSCCPTKSQKKRAGTKQVLAGTSRHYVSVLNSHRFFSDLSRHVAVVPPLEPPCPSMYVSRLILCATLIPFPTRWSMLTSQFPQVICAHLSSSPDSSPYPLTSIIPFQGR